MRFLIWTSVLAVVLGMLAGLFLGTLGLTVLTAVVFVIIVVWIFSMEDFQRGNSTGVFFTWVICIVVSMWSVWLIKTLLIINASLR